MPRPLPPFDAPPALTPPLPLTPPLCLDAPPPLMPPSLDAPPPLQHPAPPLPLTPPLPAFDPPPWLHTPLPFMPPPCLSRPTPPPCLSPPHPPPAFHPPPPPGSSVPPSPPGRSPPRRMSSLPRGSQPGHQVPPGASSVVWESTSPSQAFLSASPSRAPLRCPQPMFPQRLSHPGQPMPQQCPQRIQALGRSPSPSRAHLLPTACPKGSTSPQFLARPLPQAFGHLCIQAAFLRPLPSRAPMPRACPPAPLPKSGTYAQHSQPSSGGASGLSPRVHLLPHMSPARLPS
ncbi:hypothetical protein FKM82_014672 [Ascaphus truei]